MGFSKGFPKKGFTPLSLVATFLGGHFFRAHPPPFSFFAASLTLLPFDLKATARQKKRLAAHMI